MVHTCCPGVCLRLELMVLASALHRALDLAEQEGLQTACIPGACDGEDSWCLILQLQSHPIVFTSVVPLGVVIEKGACPNSRLSGRRELHGHRH